MSPSHPSRQLETLWYSRRVLAFIAFGGVAIAVTDTLHVYLWSHALGAPLSPDRLGLQFLTNLLFWLTLAGVTPIALFIAARARLDVRPHLPSVAIHLGAAVTLPLLHLAAFSLFDPLRMQRGEAFGPRFLRALLIFWALEFLAYWAVVTALYMIQYRRESAWRAKQEAELRKQEAELRMNLADARLQTLRAQLNPHFLFNTLNSIAALALNQRHVEVSEMLDRLSKLLRMVLDDRAPHEIPLVEELELLNTYLQIQQIRFEDRMSLSVSVESEALQCLVPRMILQPVVENAIVHGIGAQPGAGALTVGAACEDGLLHLTVTDTGPGFVEQDAARPLGVGLSNTIARLQQLYGARQRVECLANGQGTTVSIWLPVHTTALVAVAQ
jgi:signal transduction histidine kinase